MSCSLHTTTDTTAPTQAQLDSYNKLHEPQEPEYVCHDPETDEPLECTYDEDCCEGFVCIPDRGKGKYAKTCAHGG